MRIGEINKDNYMEYVKLFGGKSSKALDEMWGKDKKTNAGKSEEEINAMLVKMGYVEEGMIHKEGDVSWKKIVPVSDEIKNELIDTVRRQFMTNANGMSGTRDGDEIGAIMKKYRANINPSERAAVTWTLGQIVQAENQRLVDYVKANDPSWDYGKPIDKNILSDAISGNHIDTKI